MAKPSISNNPYKDFKDWLFLSDTVNLSEETIKGLNPCMIMMQFSNLGSITVFLNEQYNNLYKIYKINPLDFYNFLKFLVVKKKINPSDLCYIAQGKFEGNKELKLIREKLPELKFYEIELLLTLCKEDENYDGFAEYIGIKKVKSEKLTKKGKQQIQDSKEKIKKFTMQDWCKNFLN